MHSTVQTPALKVSLTHTRPRSIKPAAPARPGRSKWLMTRVTVDTSYIDQYTVTDLFRVQVGQSIHPPAGRQAYGSYNPDKPNRLDQRIYHVVFVRRQFRSMSQKIAHTPFCFCNNSVKNQPILMIFGTQHPHNI